MIFCVEDDVSIRDLMIYTLNVAGYEAKGFSDAASFWKALDDEMPELVLLDIMLPGEDGLSVLKKLRSRPDTGKLPVVMATAKGNEYDRVIGLDTGADDYLSKPFGMMEMVSRIRAVLRRTAQSNESNPDERVLRYKELMLDDSRHTVKAGDKNIILRLKEYELLKLFMEKPGTAFTREQLLSSVWDSDFLGDTRTIDVQVGTLRTKLGPYGNLIHTVRGVGYRME